MERHLASACDTSQSSIQVTTAAAAAWMRATQRRSGNDENEDGVMTS